MKISSPVTRPWLRTGGIYARTCRRLAWDDRVRIAFVDGVRRAEARLYLDDGERMLHGIAGAHGHGAVLCEGAARPVFGDCRVERIIVWGGGARAVLPEQPGNWRWSVRSVPDEQPEAPLQGLQRFMREAEGELAEQLATDGWLTIVDGPLNFVRSRERPVIGYVKTHQRAYPRAGAAYPRAAVCGCANARVSSQNGTTYTHIRHADVRRSRLSCGCHILSLSAGRLS